MFDFLHLSGLSPLETMKQIFSSEEAMEMIKLGVNVNQISDFFADEDLFIEAAKFALFINDDTNQKQSEVALKIFLRSNPSFCTYVSNSAQFGQLCKEFMAKCQSERAFGHFHRIILALLKWDVPCVFTTNNDINSLLVEKAIKINAAQNLLTDLLANYPETIPNSTTIQIIAEEALKNENAGFLITSIFMSLEKDSPVFYQFYKPNVLDNLLKVAAQASSNLLATDLINVVVSILNINMKLKANVNVPEQLLLSEKQINDKTIAAIDLLEIVSDWKITDCLKFFFDSEKLQKKILCKLNAINQMEKVNILMEISKYPNFLDTLITHASSLYPSPQILMLCYDLSTIRIFNSKFQKVINGPLKDKIDTLGSSYGGMSSSSSDDDVSYNNVKRNEGYKSNDKDIIILPKNFKSPFANTSFKFSRFDKQMSEDEFVIDI